jgi:hypothetical protein
MMLDSRASILTTRVMTLIELGSCGSFSTGLDALVNAQWQKLAGFAGIRVLCLLKYGGSPS